MGKLNETQRSEIVQMYTSGEFKAKEIAEMFAINQQTVYNTLFKAGIQPKGRWPKAAESAPKAATPPKVAIVKAEEEPAKMPQPDESAVPNPEQEDKSAEPATKICSKCDKEFNSEFAFCPWCGEKAKTPGELIMDGLLSARAKCMNYIPNGMRTSVDKQFVDTINYMRWLMKKTGQC